MEKIDEEGNGVNERRAGERDKAEFYSRLKRIESFLLTMLYSHNDDSVKIQPVADGIRS